MRSIAKGILVAVAAVAAFGTAAVADTKSPVDAPKVSTPAAVTTGSIRSEPTFEQRVQECMQIWDKGTHMTKEQWRRSCKTTLQSLSKD
jgi:hypothetical protein